MKRNEVRGGAEVSKVKCGERIDVGGVYGGKMIELAGSTWVQTVWMLCIHFMDEEGFPG